MTEVQTSGALDLSKAPKSKATRKKRGVLRIILWIFVAILAFLLIVQIAVASKFSAQVRVIEGEKKVGVNPTDERLDFGDLSGNTSATRYVTLNAGGMDTYVKVVKFGSIAELIDVNKTGFIMNKGDSEKLEFTLYMPPSAPVGNEYTGGVWVFKIPVLFN